MENVTVGNCPISKSDNRINLYPIPSITGMRITTGKWISPHALGTRVATGVYDLQMRGMRGNAGIYGSIALRPQVCLVRVRNLGENWTLVCAIRQQCGIMS